MAHLLDKEFKTVLTMSKNLKEDVKTVKKKMMYEQNRNTNKEIENLKRNQKKILELKSTITEMKNSLE